MARFLVRFQSANADTIDLTYDRFSEAAQEFWHTVAAHSDDGQILPRSDYAVWARSGVDHDGARWHVSLIDQAPESNPTTSTTVGTLREGETGTITEGQFAGRAFAVRTQGGSGRTTWVDWDTGTNGVITTSTPCERTTPADFCAARGHAVRILDNREQDTCPRCGTSLSFSGT